MYSFFDKLRNLFLKRRYRKPYLVSNHDFIHSDFMAQLKKVRKSYEEQNLVSTFDNYRDFIQGITELSNAEIVPLKDLFATPTKDKHFISLRYDIDADPVTALRMARYNARFGICGSFYILHTAYYYGTIYDGAFLRNPLLKEWLLGFIVAGCEIGLHIDPFNLYIDYGVDGAGGICQELKWLRKQGAKVFGTVAHNSFPAYGAENFEIFRGRTIYKRCSFKKNGIKVPLRILDEKKLGLSYEGNYAKAPVSLSYERANEWLNSTNTYAAQSEDWMRTYLFENPYCQWGADVIIWPVSGTEWSISAKPSGTIPFFKWKVSAEETLSVLKNMPPGTHTSVVFHPIYFSADADNA